MKKIDLNKTVFELVSEFPELTEIMVSLGFKDITKKIMLNSVGRMITIPKGAKMKGIPMENVLTALRENGFEVALSRKELLKSYLQRLNKGESLESVRVDFVEHFEGVDYDEIMQAEQEMMEEGVPLREVQHLCDVHSALFHGKMATEQSHEESVTTTNQNVVLATKLRDIDGHPLQTFYTENKALKALLDEKTSLREKVGKSREIAIHYAKKGDLLYPLLKVKYGIYGPSEVMWTVDDEIRDELTRLVRDTSDSDEWNNRAEAVLQRAAEMVYKEDNILFPLCAANFSDEEWKQIYRDSLDYAPCLGVQPNTWNEAEQQEKSLPAHEGEIVMPGGHLTIEQLRAMLNTLPFEITFVDAQNINRYFNEGPKLFKRPAMAIDRDVFSCHPPKIEPMVRAIINDFRSGKRDQVPVWMEKLGRLQYINYMAVRDHNGQYLGTVEIVQDMEFAKKHFEK
ncbi:MAG: DUF438 domain-containing protein [Bacteroidaceae bacterium]|uniref:DUF438 domain-containing protein n=1 Tax=Pseudoprevotella muciniphila TaxID=2133944 RepID=A0A5P8E7T4_9BACT|nr:DUF438 domain-containing protein [Pseudoprevotella muciniphila]MBQ7057375.1 DUF438 domain-containing protein [Bacteroidaceae bacterium]MBQ7664825.1 DUF438 domain-containing protein [Bacteroidaceae bacterium]QFQ13033.1 DUF438 domain-containing protein [Pseudoprevotella muciniphila]